MRLKTKLLCIVLAVALLAALLVGCSAQKVEHQPDQNVLSNGNFESTDSDWQITTSSSEMPTFPYTASTDKVNYQRNGHYYLSITERSSGSYTWYQQTVPVQKNSVYCLKCDYRITTKVDVSTNARGAYLGLVGLEFASDSDTETGDWKTFTVYFDTDKYTEVTVAVGMGDVENKAVAGTVLFDNVSLSLVDSAAITTVGRTRYVQDGTVAVVNLASGGTLNYRDAYRTTVPDIVYMVLVVVLGAALLVGAYFALRGTVRRDEPVVQQNGVVKGSNFFQNPTFLLVVSLLVAFGIRLLLSLTIYGYGAYQNTLMKDAAAMAENGLWAYYLDSTAYAPGAMYLMYTIGLLAVPLKLTVATQGFAIFIKIPAIIADLLTVMFVFIMANREKGSVYAFVVSMVLALCPVFFMASAVWSVYASVGVLFLVLTAMAVRNRSVIKTTIFYTLAVLFMEEALLLLPLLLTYAVTLYIKYPELRIKLPLCATLAIVVGYAVTVPLVIDWFAAGHPFIVIEKYVAYFSANNYFARNVFNLYAMCGVGAETVNTTGRVFSGIFAALAMLGAIGLYIRRRNRQDLVLLMAWTLVALYMLCVGMNLWVLMAAIVLLVVYAVYTQEKRVMWIAGAFSTIACVNACYTMFVGGNVQGGAGAAGVTIGSLDPVAIVFSTLAFVTFLAFCYVTVDVCLVRKKLLMPLADRTADADAEE